MSFVASHVAVVPLRAEPSIRAEQVNEVLCGERLGVLEEITVACDTWIRVRCDDGYVGWLPRRRVSAVDADWPGEAGVRVGKRDAALVDPSSGRVSRRVVFGSWLRCVRADAETLLVELPDGTTGYVSADVEMPFYGSTASLRDRFHAVLDALLGVPYRWGGRSVFGFDCSGFAQFIAEELGLSLPRDSSDQEAAFHRDATAVSRDGITLGDFLFWGDGDVATHVGVGVDVGRFVHARDWVRIGSFSRGPDADLERIFRGGWRHPDLYRRLISHGDP